MQAIADNEILQKIIEIQSCIIKGKKVKTLLHQNRTFYLDKSKADTIVIYMHEDGHINTEYILEAKKKFYSLIQKYIATGRNFSWSTFVRNYDSYFRDRSSSYKIESCFELFKGFISQKRAKEFTEELGMKVGYIMPLFNFDGREKIGYICFVYNSEDCDVSIDTLRALRASLEVLFQPLYDPEYHTLYTKCVRIDEEMKVLTAKEKVVIQKLFDGASNQEIAEALHLSINTVKTHIKNIFNKYNVNSRVELYKKFYVTT